MDMEKLDDQVYELLDWKQKVEAIKLVRRTTGWGLRKSKEYVDNLALAAQPAIGAAKEAALEKEVAALIRQDRFMEAIKLVRERTGWGLRECKTFVDNLLHDREEKTLDWIAIASRASQLLAQGRRDEAVEWVKAKTEMSAQEARSYVDFMAQSARRRPRARKRQLPTQAIAQVRDLLSQGRKIKAIKLVRILTNWGLRESKEYVESLEA
jgi:ribosomal protein L7/L12